MIQVLLFHAWNVGSPIGLDAFLMISAFLMTASFIRSAERGKTPFFIERWANTFKRLVPPLIVVVALSLVGVGGFSPRTACRRSSSTKHSRHSPTPRTGASLTWPRITSQKTVRCRVRSCTCGRCRCKGKCSSSGPSFCPLRVHRQAFPLAHQAGGFRGLHFLIAIGSLVWLIWFVSTDGSVYFYTRALLWEFALGSLAIATPADPAPPPPTVPSRG